LTHLSFRMMQDDEAPLCGALVVDCVLQRRGKHAIVNSHHKAAASWGQEIKVTAEKPQSMVIMAADRQYENLQGVLASAPLAKQPRIMEIEHFYTLKSSEPIGKSMMAHLLMNAQDIDVIKVNSARRALSFYKEQIGFKSEYGHIATVLFLRRNAQGDWDVTPKFAQKFM
jgi:hypothetical protein